MKKVQSHLLGLVVATLLGMNTSCVAVEDVVIPTEKNLAADSQYMSGIFETRADRNKKSFMNVDLTDERQYRFVRNRLIASGNTPETAPHLFELLERGRRGKTPTVENVPTVPGPTQDEEQVGTATQAATTNWCGHFLLLEEKVNKFDTRFHPGVVMSCFDGASYAYLDGAAYLTPDIQGSDYRLRKNGVIEQYNGGKNVSLDLGWFNFDDQQATLNNPSKTLVLDSLAIADNGITQHFTYTTVQTMGPGGAVPLPPPPWDWLYVDVPSIKLDHPRNIINSSQDPLYSDFYNGTNQYGYNPSGLRTYSWFPDNDNRVRVCLERGYASQVYGALDCDYATVRQYGNELLPFSYPHSGMAATHPNSTQTGRLVMDSAAYWPTLPKYEMYTKYIPVKGTYDVYYPGGCSIDSYDSAFTQAMIVLYQDGGFCNAGTTNDTISTGLADAFSAPDASGVKSSFNMLGNFGGECYGSDASKRSHFYAMIYAKTKGVGPCGNRYTTRRVTPVDFLKSCFIEGTEVRRADGKLLPVEQFKVGEKVIANDRGLQLTVTGLVTGGESKPIVNLYDSFGHDLFVTEMHPVVTTHRGVVKAGELVEGDEVMTESGPAVLTAVQRVAYDRQVYNLSLGTPEELSRAGKQNRTMFAEGYLVGDNEMQFEIETAPKPGPDHIASEWQRDYHYDAAKGRVTHP